MWRAAFDRQAKMRACAHGRMIIRVCCHYCGGGDGGRRLRLLGVSVKAAIRSARRRMTPMGMLVPSGCRQARAAPDLPVNRRSRFAGSVGEEFHRLLGNAFQWARRWRQKSGTQGRLYSRRVPGEGFFGVKRRSRPLCAASRSPVAQAENRRIITGSKLIGRRRRQFGHSLRLRLRESAQKSRMVFWPGKVRPLGI